MKPCPQNQMPLALLAINSLDEVEAQELHRHLATCAACIGYLNEIKNLARNIVEVQPLMEVPRSPEFHRRLLNRLEAERPGPLSSKITNLFRGFSFSWRSALPVLGASAAAIAVLLVLHYQGKTNQPSAPVVSAVPSIPNPKADFSPTLSNYQFLANHSPDKLDELLTRESRLNPAPAPVYTPATLSRSELLE